MSKLIIFMEIMDNNKTTFIENSKVQHHDQQHC